MVNNQCADIKGEGRMALQCGRLRGVSVCVCVSLRENKRTTNILCGTFFYYFFISLATLRITRARSIIYYTHFTVPTCNMYGHNNDNTRVHT